jgi:hypothetical protein
MHLDVIGFAHVEPGANASLAVRHAGEMWQPLFVAGDQGYPDEFAGHHEVRLPAGRPYEVELLLSVQAPAGCSTADANAFLAVDVIEVEVNPLHGEP